MKKLYTVLCSAALVTMIAAPVFAADAPAAAPAAPAAKTADVMGTVAKVDAKAMTVAVKTDAGEEKVITWDANTKVMGKDGKAMTSADVKEGGKVTVKATDNAGKWMATEIHLN